MNRFFPRIVALLVIPGLLVNTAWAQFPRADSATPNANLSAQSMMEQQALAASVMWVRPHPSAARLYRIAKSLTTKKGWQDLANFTCERFTRSVVRSLQKDRRGDWDRTYTREQARAIWRSMRSDKRTVLGLIKITAVNSVTEYAVWPLSLYWAGPFFGWLHRMQTHQWEYAAYTFVLTLIRPVVILVLARKFGLRYGGRLAFYSWFPFVGGYMPLIRLVEEEPVLVNYLLNTPIRHFLTWPRMYWRVREWAVRHGQDVVRLVDIWVINPAQIIPVLLITGTAGYVLQRLGLLSHWWLWGPSAGAYLFYVLGELRILHNPRSIMSPDREAKISA